MNGKPVKQAEALRALCEEQLGGTWSIRMWQNLGWHYSAVFANDELSVAIHYNGSARLSAFLNRPDFEKGHPVAAGCGIWAASGNTPIEAFKAALAKAHDSMDSKIAVLRAADEFLDWKED